MRANIFVGILTSATLLASLPAAAAAQSKAIAQAASSKWNSNWSPAPAKAPTANWSSAWPATPAQASTAKGSGPWSAAPAQAPTAKQSSTRSAAITWEAGYLGLSALDAIQTMNCLHRSTCHEGNPIWGTHPSDTKIILAKVGGGLIHVALFKALLDRSPKYALRAAQISFAIQGTVVVLNARF
jgi:hypothetical protein